MKRAKKTYGSCLNSLQSLKYLTKSSAEAGDKEDLIPDGSAGFSIQDTPSEKIPWKAIALATFLAIGGVIQLTAGVFIFTGHIGTEYEDRFYSFLILGMIMFIPGAYYLFIALAAYKNLSGYSFSDIPDFD
uniref:Transmembrane protein 230 n=1 Tax=Cacopsylla melanoneura TaxID=428564 RepID=A0A8D8VI43_9HEMI